MAQLVMNAIFVMAALVAVLDYFGVKPPKTFSQVVSMSTNRGWKLWVMLGLVAWSLGMSSYSFYESTSSPSTAIVKWSKPLPPFDVIEDQTFVNEKVLLDGHEYRHCTFRNVSFVYNGTGPMSFHDNTVIGVVGLVTESDSVTTTLAVVRGLGFSNPDIPFTGGPQHNPVPDVQPPIRQP